MVDSDGMNPWSTENGIQLGKLVVYKNPLNSLKDPNFQGEIKQLDVNDVLVAPDQQAADRLGSWVVDPKIRSLITDYSRNQRRVLAIMDLRNEGKYDEAAAKEIGGYKYKELWEIYGERKY